MSHQPVSVSSRADAAEFRKLLLGQLGLQADANDQDIEAAHNGLVDFLELASPEMKSWAAAQTAEVDEAFALLCGPEQALVDAAQEAATPQNRPDTSSAPGSPAPSTAAASTPAGTSANPVRTKRVVVVLALIVVVAVVFGVYSMGKSADAPSTASTPTAQKTTEPAESTSAVPVDKKKVAALTKKVSANPNDVGSLQALGNIYFAAADYSNASTWVRKVIAVDPKNQSALLALGASQFNLGNAAEAKKHWLVAAGLYPNVAEVHYDLGFLYMSQTPPDTARMTAEWKKVVAIDPTSDLAKTVNTHLKGATSSPTSSATPSATATAK